MIIQKQNYYFNKERLLILWFAFALLLDCLIFYGEKTDMCNIHNWRFHKLFNLLVLLWIHIHWRMADGLSSFWGPATSTDWCEKNYVYSSYIAEFFNTMSNVPCIVLAFIGLVNALRQRFEKRFSVLHMSNIILAIGSMLYHSTLQRV